MARRGIIEMKSRRWLAFGALGSYFIQHCGSVTTLSEADRKSFVCNHPCRPFVETGIINAPYSLLIATNQDGVLVSPPPLQRINVRAPCVDFPQILRVLGSTRNITLNITADVVDMGTLTALPRFTSLNIVASEMRKATNSSLDLIKNQGTEDSSWSLFDLLGYDSIFNTSIEPNILYTPLVFPRRPSGLDIHLNIGRLTSPHGPFALVTSVTLPRVRNVTRLELDANRWSVIYHDFCSSYGSFAKGQLPIVCRVNRRAPGMGLPLDIAIHSYFFDYDYFNTETYPAPGDVTVFLQSTDSTYLQTEVFRPTFENKYTRATFTAAQVDQRYTPVRQLLASGKTGIQDLFNPLSGLYLEITVVSILTAPYLTARRDATLSDVRPLGYPDQDLLWLLRTCYNSLIYFQPTAAAERRLLQSSNQSEGHVLISRRTQLAVDNTTDSLAFWAGLLSNLTTPTIRSDLTLAEFLRLYQDITTNYEPGQLSITDTQLSVDVYTSSLVLFAESYVNTLENAQNALNFLAEAAQRRAAAQLLVQRQQQAEFTELSRYQKLVADQNDAWNAIVTVQGLVGKAAKAANDAYPAVQRGLETYRAIDTINFIGQSVSAIANLFASTTKTERARFKGLTSAEKVDSEGNPLKFFRQVGDTLSKNKDAIKRTITNLGGDLAKSLRLTLNDAQKLKKGFDFNPQIDKYIQTNTTLSDLDYSSSVSDLFIAVLDKAITSADPTLYTDEIRSSLTQDLFSLDSVALNQALLNWQDLKDKLQSDWKFLLDNNIQGTTEFLTQLYSYHNAALQGIQLQIEFNDISAKVITAGVQYLTAITTRIEAQRFLDADSSLERLSQLSLNLLLQATAQQGRVLVVLNQACNAFTYASLLPCPVSDAVRTGRDPFNIFDQARSLTIRLRDATSRAGLQSFRATYTFQKSGVASLRINNTVTFQVDPDNPDFAGYYAVNVDEVRVRFTGIRISPPGTRVRVNITSSGFHLNKDLSRRSFSFRGPSFDRVQIFDDTRIIIPATYYPGDRQRYYKPSPFQTWSLEVGVDAGQPADAVVDLSAVTSVQVIFIGRAGVRRDLTAATTSADTGSVATLLQDQCPLRDDNHPQRRHCMNVVSSSI